MEYTNKQLENHVNRIKLTQKQKSSYSQQIENLKENVVKAVNSMENTRVIKVKRAGSWKKGTALAPKSGRPLDVDLVIYMDVEENTSFDAEELRDEIIKVLCKAYPNKNQSDFTGGNKTIGIVFRGSGLEVDIVPFIPEKGNTTYGRQPRKRLNSGEFKTSVDKQLAFSVDLKSKYRIYTPVIRVLKAWRNYQELELSSFSIELGVAHLAVTGALTNASISAGLVAFFELFGNGNPMQVFFPGAIGIRPNANPWIADPTNNQNNTLRLSRTDWQEVIQVAEVGFETISYARVVRESSKTLALWQEVFGPSFRVTE